MNETLLLAKLLVAASAIHANSYVPTRYVTTLQGDRVQGSGGYYAINQSDAIARAMVQISDGRPSTLVLLSDMSEPARLMLAYTGESVEWAMAYIKRAEEESKPDPVSADIIALAAADIHATEASLNGLIEGFYNKP